MQFNNVLVVENVSVVNVFSGVGRTLKTHKPPVVTADIGLLGDIAVKNQEDFF